MESSSNQIPSSMLSSGLIPIDHHLPLHHHHPPPQHLSSSTFPATNSSPNYPPLQHQHPKPKHQPQLSAFSEDDDDSNSNSAVFRDDANNGDASAGVGGKRISPWQRMKWTDDMVRLLIMAVYYVGDDNLSETAPPVESGKKKPNTNTAAASASGVLQKKGKWKSVSRAMMDKGYYVSPQQCEDKFNDLNKRYKRVNDILGKGTACRVVENQNLLETMELSPKMKDEARKLLNSKHLFFREMCAYHTSCALAGVAGHQACEVADGASQPPQTTTKAGDQQHCFHRNDVSQPTGGSRGGNTNGHDHDAEEDDDEEREDEDDDEEEDDDDIEDELGDEEGGGKRRRSRLSSPHQLQSELTNVMQDGMKSVWEQRQWLCTRALMLEEQKVAYQSKALELEKERLKWQKFSRKKEREMERMRLENEKAKLENERMMLMLRQKEIELESFNGKRASDLSSMAG